MRFVDFNPDDLPPEKKQVWDKWADRAEKATAAAIEEWEKSKGKTKVKLNEDIWKKLKEFLQENKVFQKKCAYCESRYLAVDHGDAEHFRPKKGIVNKDNHDKNLPPEKTKDAKGRSIVHPGYFWLAYHWRNLVPACGKCNSAAGKMNQFPAMKELVYLVNLTKKEVDKLTREHRPPRPSKEWPGFYYPEPDHLDDLEDRLLLHPYRDRDPRSHLVFDMNGDVLAGEINGVTSEQGEQSIKVYDLDRKDLIDERHEAQRDKFQKYLTYYVGLEIKAEDEDKDEEVDTENEANEWLEHRLSKWEYSAAIADYCDYKLRKLSRTGI